MANRSWAGAALLFLACSGAPTRPACSDEAYAALTTECVAAAIRCRKQGGTEEECGMVCDGKAEEWSKSCQ